MIAKHENESFSDKTNLPPFYIFTQGKRYCSGSSAASTNEEAEQIFPIKCILLQLLLSLSCLHGMIYKEHTWK